MDRSLLTEKWGDVLDFEGLPKLKGQKRSDIAALLENTEKAVQELFHRVSM